MGFAVNAKKTLTNMAELGFEIETSKAAQGLIVFESKEYHSVGFKTYEIDQVDFAFHLRRSLERTGFTHMRDEEAHFESALFDEPLM